MNTFTLLALTAGLVAIAQACRWLRNRNARDFSLCLENVGEGTHDGGRITLKVDATVTTRYLLAKQGSDVDHADICGASDIPLGVFTDEAAAIEDQVAVEVLGPNTRTLLMVPSETMTYDDDVYAAAAGKVQDLPTAPGTYYKVGKALSAGVADGLIEVAPCFPEKKVVVAALTATALTGSLTGTVNGAMVDVAASAGACAGGSSPTASNVDTAIATAVATIVTGVNEQNKELLTKINAIIVDITAIRTALTI